MILLTYEGLDDANRNFFLLPLYLALHKYPHLSPSYVIQMSPSRRPLPIFSNNVCKRDSYAMIILKLKRM